MDSDKFWLDDIGNLPDNVVREWRRSEQGFIQHFLQQAYRELDGQRRITLEQAMQLEAPDIAKQGFDSYRDKLAIDREGGALMVMLDQGGAAWRPIVFFPEVDSGVELGRLVVSYTPLAGAEGWQAFQQLRARNRMPS